MPDANKLTLLFIDGGRDRLLAGVNLAASALALGKTVQVFLSWEALRRVATGTMATAPLPSSLDEADRARIEAELEGQPTLDSALQSLREQGVKAYACSNTLHMLGLPESSVADCTDGISGAPGFLAMAEGGSVITL